MAIMSPTLETLTFGESFTWNLGLISFPAHATHIDAIGAISLVATDGGMHQALSFLSYDTAANSDALMASHPIQIPDGAGDWVWSYWKGLYWMVEGDEWYKEFKVWKATDVVNEGGPGDGSTTIDIWISTARGTIMQTWTAQTELPIFSFPSSNLAKETDNEDPVPGVGAWTGYAPRQLHENHATSGTALMIESENFVRMSNCGGDITVNHRRSITGPFWLAMKVKDSATAGVTTNQVINYSYIHWN